MHLSERKRRAARVIIRSRKPTEDKVISAEENPASVANSRTVGGPIIVRTTEGERSGVHSFNTTRYAIGYVIAGRKHLYMGDERWEASAGDVFFMGRGKHFIEDIPSRGRRGFEQIVFYYTPEQVSRALANLSVNYELNTCVDHTCEECMRNDHVIATCQATLRQFFDSTLAQLQIGFYENNSTAELLALTSLVYHIVSQTEGCLRTRVLGSTDPEKELMERIIHEYIYTDISLDELARRNNRSLSGFKKKFREHFGEAPHRWVVQKRLMHARLVVISTNKTTAEIARECNFGNCSHFIDLFRREYGLTPSKYRKKYRADMASVPAEEEEE